MKNFASSPPDAPIDANGEPMKRGSSEPMSPEMEARLRTLAAMPDDSIDYSDIPEITDFTGFVRGKFYRPIKRQITLRLDADVIDFFEADGKGYQTRINDALREWVDARRNEAKAG